MDFNPNLSEPVESEAIDENIDPGFSVDTPASPAAPDMNVPATPGGVGSMPQVRPDRPGFRPPFIPDRPGWSSPVIPDRPSSPVINIFPKPVIPCYFCNTSVGSAASVRFLNASTGYNAFSVYINNRLVTTDLNSDEITRYTQYSPGFYTVTIMGGNGYVYVQKPVQLSAGTSTIAIVNSSSGLDLKTLRDLPCGTPNSSACIRVCNLAFYSGAVNVALNNITFSAVAFGRTADSSRVRPGSYRVAVSRTSRPGNTLVTTFANLNANRVYTLYILNWSSNPDTIRTLLIEDRR